MTTTRPFSSVLVANRGEIACRIIRSARALGHRTVAVYSDADADALHVRMADVATRIGEAPVQASYLAIDRLIAAARRTGADAVHPGYGLLSENPDFAAACADAGLVFIGPTAAAIRSMGNKVLAKRLMAEAQVPTIPGWAGDAGAASDDGAAWARAAAEVGYPVLIKAAAGGGGRGMRLCAGPAELAAATRAARAEAESAFGNGELMLERALVGARHVEVQVLADAHGHVVHLGERDCSVQRRHQKIIEEAPSPAVGEDLRRRMGETAVKAARAIGYLGAGTVELLLDSTGAFYFLEMNTRLQVEHPVTEMVTGLDLVALQLRIAAGEPLPFAQEEIAVRGHAIEARLYAEDPYDGFLPRTGRVLRFRPAALAAHERIDHGLRQGQEVTGWYDPLLAKLVAWGETREHARRKLARLLADTVVLGVTTNKSFLGEVLAHPEVAAGRATTTFIADHLCSPGGASPRRPPSPGWIAAAAAALLCRAGDDDPFYSSGDAAWPVRLVEAGAGETAAASSWVRVVGPGRYQVTGAAGAGVAIGITAGEEPGEVRVVAGEVEHPVRFCRDGAAIHLDAGGATYSYEELAAGRAAAARAGDASARDGRVLAPMNGRIVAVNVAPGDAVARGQVVAVVEAMKMHCPVTADLDGRVAEVLVRADAQVATRQLLVQITPGG